MSVVFLLVWLLLSPILHVRFAFVFALTAGLLEIVPTLGPIASAIAPILIALADSPAKALWVLVGFIVIQQIESHLIIPLILGRGLRLHPVTVVFVVVVMAWLFGIVGIFLAVPLCAVAKTLFEDLYLEPRETKRQEDVSGHVEQIVAGQTEETPGGRDEGTTDGRTKSDS
jgi:predicted PurR-regulated permease PerM